MPLGMATAAEIRLVNADGLVRSDASSERLRQAGGTPVRGTVLDLDVLAKAAASGESLAWLIFRLNQPIQRMHCL